MELQQHSAGEDSGAPPQTHMREAAYCRWRGCTQERLRQLKEKGCVVLEAGLVNVAETERRIAAVQQTRTQHKRNEEKGRGARNGAAGNGAANGHGEASAPGTERMSYTLAQIESARALARQRTIKADREEGRLVETEKVARWVSSAFKETSQALLRLPDRLTAELWQERNEHRFRQRLEEEIRAELRALAERLQEVGQEEQPEETDDAGGPE